MNSAARAIKNEIEKREREITALKTALATLSGNGALPASKRRGRKPLTAAQKKAISQAMKAAWKKRKAQKASA